MRAPGRTPRLAFTLVELLVVLAIVAILAAILLPVLARARAESRKTTCLSNLRQLGTSLSLYVQDHDDCFPNTGDPYLWMGRRWRWPLTPYLGFGLRRSSVDPSNPNVTENSPPMVLLCPVDATAPAAWDSTSYSYSAAFYHTPSQIDAMGTTDLYGATAFACVTQTLSSVTTPTAKVLLGEWLSNHSSDRVNWWNWQGARNYLFVDGHAKYLQARQIAPAGNGFPDPNLTRGGIGGSDLR